MLQRLMILAGLLLALAVQPRAWAGASNDVMFNYQGRVLVDGSPFTGVGEMKVAILTTSGTAISLWSNDGSSVAGGEPTTSFPVQVIGGIFDFMVGDTDFGMDALPGVIFNRDDELAVRVWFDDGTNGFQQLSPDRRLTNPRRLGIDRIAAPLVLYVDAATGNDLNDGLTTATAKQSIQSAIDMLPKQIDAATNINVTSGTYAGCVLEGFLAGASARLQIVGGPETMPTRTADLPVVIAKSASPAGMNSGILFVDCHNVRVVGVQVQGFSHGFDVENSSTRVTLAYCRATGCTYGFRTVAASDSWMASSLSDNNQFGIGFSGNANINMENSITEYNSTGIIAYFNSSMVFLGTNYCRNNTTGVVSRYNCAMASSTRLTFSSNGTNSDLAQGSYLYP